MLIDMDYFKAGNGYARPWTLAMLCCA